MVWNIHDVVYHYWFEDCPPDEWAQPDPAAHEEVWWTPEAQPGDLDDVDE